MGLFGFHPWDIADPTKPGWIFSVIDAIESGADEPTHNDKAWTIAILTLFLVITIVLFITCVVARRRYKAKPDEEGGIAPEERDARDDSSRLNRRRLRFWRAKVEEKLGRRPPPAAESAAKSDAPPTCIDAESDAPPTYPAAVRPARAPRLARPARRGGFGLPSSRPAYVLRPGYLSVGQAAQAYRSESRNQTFAQRP